MPEGSAVETSESGSMTLDLLPVFIENFHNNVRAYLPAEEHVVLTLDGHKSRMGLDCLNAFLKYKIEVVQALANTTHFLQPCDSFVNKAFKANMRRFRDYMCSAMHWRDGGLWPSETHNAHTPGVRDPGR